MSEAREQTRTIEEQLNTWASNTMVNAGVRQAMRMAATAIASLREELDALEGAKAHWVDRALKAEAENQDLRQLVPAPAPDPFEPR